MTLNQAEILLDDQRSNLITDLMNTAKYAEEFDSEDLTEVGCDGPSIDVRICLRPWDALSYLTGDSSYDQDHRGFWGTSGVWPGMTLGEASDVADDLIDQVLDHVAINE